MASLPSSSPGKPPLRLKDFLKEDTNSDSCGGATGFRTVPRRLPDHTVRLLLAVELGESASADRSLRSCRSKGALTKINAVINAVKMLPFVSSSASCIHDCNKPLPKQGSFLSRSFSRRLRRSFWRKREKGDHRVENVSARSTVRVKDIVRLGSFGEERRETEVAEKTGPRSPPSPVRSTKSSSTSGGGGGGGGWSDTDSAESDLSSSCGSSVCCGDVKDGLPDMDANRCASPRSPFRGVGGDSISKATCYREPLVKEEEMGGTGIGCPCQYEEEKDQLSPVSVMDFSYDDDDEDNDEAERAAAAAADSPPSFHHSLAKLERTKHHLLQKIREFESLAALVDPADLETRFASSDDEPEAANGREDWAGHGGELHEEDDIDTEADDDQLLQFQVEIKEWALSLLRELQRRQGTKPGGGVDGLLVDFFIERLSCCRQADVDVQIRTMRTKRPCCRAAREEEEMLLRAAEDWMGRRRRGEDASSRAGGVREMDMDGRWRCPHVEEGENISGDLEAGVLESLVDELMLDLFQD